MKIGIVGAGMVGSSAAYAMTLMRVGTDIVLVDHSADLAVAQAQDIAHAAPFASSVSVVAGDYGDLDGAAVVILAAGVSQKPGETRPQLLGRNMAVFRDIIGQITKYAPDAILLVATNPVDVMTLVAQRISGLPPARVLGSGTILDTARFRSLLGSHLGITPQSVHAYILGEHGDSEVAVWSSAMAGSVQIGSFAEQIGRPLDAAARSRITRDVRDAAYSIIKGKGATYYGIGAGLARIVRSIIADEEAVWSVSAVTAHIADLRDVPLSLPRVIAREGIRHELTPPLDEAEQQALETSARAILEMTKELDI